MPLDAEERASIITQMLQKKFGALLNWKRAVLVHDFGANNLDQVDRFTILLNETVERVQTAFEEMSDAALVEARTQFDGPVSIGTTEWGSLLANKIAKLHQVVPSPVAYGFGHPNFAANFEHWARMPKLSLHEVSLLSLGADPKSMRENGLSELKKQQDRGKRLWAAHRSLLEQREIFSRCFHHTGYGYASEPIGKIKRWIDDLQIGVHPEFYEGLETRIQPKPLNRLEIEETKRQDSSKVVSDQEVETMLKLIAAMALKGYSFNPDAKRNQATADIQTDLDTLGIPLDQKTVLKWVRAACSIVPDDCS